MAYTLKLTNGKILTTLPDQVSDGVTTSLTLIGKNVNAYGTDINQNYIRILENFANNVAPRAPLAGQLWFDTVTSQIKVYVPTSNASGEFKPVGAPIIRASEPATLAIGDLWFDSSSDQLKFKKDASTVVVIGPDFDASIGKSGWVSETFEDNLSGIQNVAGLYSNNVLLGILSTASFTIVSTETRTSLRSVSVGITANYSDGLPVEFVGTATSARSLTRANDQVVTVEEVLIDVEGLEITHGLKISSSTEVALSLGVNEDIQFFIEGYETGSVPANTTATMLIGGIDQPFQLQITPTNSDITRSALYVDSLNGRIGVFTTTPATTFDVNGDVTIHGNVFVLGTTTYITSQDLQVIDKEIQLAWVPEANRPPDTPETRESSDALVDGGGLVLRSWRDKEIRWVKATNAWSLSDNVNLTYSTGTFKIGGFDVLGEDILYPRVTRAPGLTQIGNLNSLNVGNFIISSSTIGSSVPSNTITIGDTNTLRVDLSGKKIVNVDMPSIADGTSTYLSSVATVEFVQDYVTIARNPKIALTIDVTGKAVNPEDDDLDDFVILMLTQLYDPNEPDPNYATPNNARAKVLAVRYTTPPLQAVPSNFLDPGLPLFVDKAGVAESAAAIQWNEFLRVTTDLPAANLGVNRVIKQYVVTGGVWTKLPYSGASNLVWLDPANPDPVWRP